MQWLTNLLGGNLVTGIGSTVEQVAGVFGVNKEAQAQRDYEASDRDTNALMSAQRQFAREFTEPRNFFDSVINGLNRLPRPLMAFGAIALLIGPFINPIEYSASISALQLIPEYLWGIIGAVFAFYFGSRAWQEKRRMQVTADHTKEVMRHMREIRAMKPARKASPVRDAPAVAEHDDEDMTGEHEDENAPADRLARKA